MVVPSPWAVSSQSQVPFIDVSAARAVETIANDGKISNKLVYISGMSDQIRNMLTDLMGDVVPRDHYFDVRKDAITAAVNFVESTEAKKLEEFRGEPSLA